MRQLERDHLYLRAENKPLLPGPDPPNAMAPIHHQISDSQPHQNSVGAAP
jgi:hypothetical protein